MNLSDALREIASDLDGIAQDRLLPRESHFVERAEAGEYLQTDVLDRIAALLGSVGRSGEETSGEMLRLLALRQRAEALLAHWAELDAQLFARQREMIRSGQATPAALRALLDRYAAQVARGRGPNEAGYDALDQFAVGLLGLDAVPEATRQRTPGMVFYQPTPARIILAFIDRVQVTAADVFYDLGSGLGQVAILVHLLTGAIARGIEFEPVYVVAAQSCAQRLGLAGVEFINEDARSADYAAGNVFFAYTPFTGPMLDAVLTRLEEQAHRRPIRLGTYGPCTAIVARVPWLRRIDRGMEPAETLAVFASR